MKEFLLISAATLVAFPDMVYPVVIAVIAAEVIDRSNRKVIV